MCDGLMNDYELLDAWEVFMLANGKSPVTIEKYSYAILRLMAALKPRRPVREVTEQDVVVFLAGLGKAAAARSLYLNAFRSVFRWAADGGLMVEDPVARIHPKDAPEKDPDAFSPEEVAALVTAARKSPKVGERDALAILTCYALGLRRSELCRLTPDDIDWGGQRVYIQPSKGGKDRWVEANELALDALEGLRPWWNGTVVGSLHPDWFSMIVNQAAKRAGFPPGRRNAHMLRSAFATALMEEGADVTVVSKLLGHKNLATTMRYRAIRQQSKKDAVARLPVPKEVMA